MGSANWTESLLSGFVQPVLLGSEDLAWQPLRYIEAHKHSFYQLDYFYEGTGTVCAAGRSYTVVPGDLFIFNPGDFHEFRSAAKAPLRGISHKFRRGPGPRTARLPNHLANLSHLPAPQQRELHELLHRGTVELNGHRKGHAEAATALLRQFFILLARYWDEFERHGGEERGGRSGAVQLVLDYIRRNYHQPLALRDLGRVAGLHPRYLCQRFSEEMGAPPMDVLARERVEVAKNLLVRTRLPIKQIGAQVGYPDIFHFSKRFKALAGASPNRYREVNQYHPIAAQEA